MRPISVQKLTDHLLGICRRFKLDPEKVSVLIDGEWCEETFISLQMNDDGAMRRPFDEDANSTGRRAFADELGDPDELYRCVWLAISQTASRSKEDVPV